MHGGSKQGGRSWARGTAQRDAPSTTHNNNAVEDNVVTPTTTI